MSMFGDFANIGTFGILPSDINIASMLPFGIGQGYTNQKNLEAQEANLAWQQFQQATTWQREDNAVQRRAADLKSAGLSPVLAAGSAASSGPIVSTTTPQRGPTPDTAGMVMALLKMKQDISMTEAQEELIKKQQDLADVNFDLIEAKADTAKHDLNIFQKTGTASNASGIVKDIRDAFGLSDSPVVKSAKKAITDKLEKAGFKTPGKSMADDAKEWYKEKWNNTKQGIKNVWQGTEKNPFNSD